MTQFMTKRPLRQMVLQFGWSAGGDFGEITMVLLLDAPDQYNFAVSN